MRRRMKKKEEKVTTRRVMMGMKMMKKPKNREGMRVAMMKKITEIIFYKIGFFLYLLWFILYD